MKNPLVERPWLLVVVGLAAFVLAWTVFLVIATTHPTESVPLVPSKAATK
ncbi:MAG: hypothetical protein IPL39_06000 [Opitutaceae bacterium]|nr:hypothetical protein [Opitutaceae bacterium]